MAHSVLLTKKGYSLIELLVAMAILAVVAVALMKSSLLVIQKNQQNELREEAVRIAEQRMNEIRSGPGGFDNPNPSGNHVDLVAEIYTWPAMTRTIRGGTVSYTIKKEVSALNLTTKSVTLTVSWLFGNNSFNHAIMSIVKR